MKEKENLIEKLGRWINMAGVAVMMNLMFILACLPVVTIGQAWCGLMGALRYNIRGDSWFQGFKAGYKTRFLRGTAAWCIGLLVCMFFLNDINNAMAAEALVPLIASCVMFALAAMLLSAALTLNVYIPTDVNTWIKNTVNLLGKAVFQTLICAGLFWLPVVVLLLYNAWIIYELILVLIGAYFALVAIVTTVLMKDPLTDLLVQARADGTLTAEEGRMPIGDEEE